MALWICMLAATTVLYVNPPVNVEWATATVSVGMPTEGRPGECIALDAHVLGVSMTQFVAAAMSDEERSTFVEVVQQFVSDYSSATNLRERVSASLPLIHQGVLYHRTIKRSWILIDDNLVSTIFVFDTPTGTILFNATDEVTGRYLQLQLKPSSQDGWKEILPRVDRLSKTSDPSEAQDLANSINDSQYADQEIQLEVDGRVVYRDFNASQGDFRDIVNANLLPLWVESPTGPGRDRLGTALGILMSSAVAPDQLGGYTLGFPDFINPTHLVGRCFAQPGLRFSNVSRGGGVGFYESPPDELIELFLGDDALVVPDPNWPIEKLVEEWF